MSRFHPLEHFKIKVMTIFIPGKQQKYEKNKNKVKKNKLLNIGADIALIYFY